MVLHLSGAQSVFAFDCADARGAETGHEGMRVGWRSRIRVGRLCEGKPAARPMCRCLRLRSIRPTAFRDTDREEES
jgi:hypothetical protein